MAKHVEYDSFSQHIDLLSEQELLNRYLRILDNGPEWQGKKCRETILLRMGYGRGGSK